MSIIASENGWNVVEMERFSQTPLFSSEPRHGWTATAEDECGDRITLSRYDDETAWLADSFIRSNGFPVFVHGEGERYIAKRQADPWMQDLLDRAREIARFPHMKDKS